MTRDEFLLLSEFLDELGTLTLATQGPDGPWAASLFFARDEQLNLYFISDRNSRHARELLECGTVAVTVNDDYRHWAGIRGLQIAGRANRVPRARRSEVAELYLKKFGELEKLIENPGSAEEKIIARRFAASDFFCIRPMTIKMIDNARGFGNSSEFTLDR